MSNRQKLIIALGLAVLCGLILRSAFSKSPKALSYVPPADAPVYAENDVKASGGDSSQLIAASTTTVTQAPAPVIKPAAGDGKADPSSDGKTVLPPVGEDGKTVIPTDGKESLPPVGQFINSQPQNVDPSQVGPPTEYRNTNSRNPLLSPPNPNNVAGPIVSQEAP